MESLTRFIVLVSAVAAVSLQAFVVARGWSELPVVLVAAVALVSVAAWRRPGAVHGALAAFPYIGPAIWLLTIGRFYHPYLVVWLGALLAALVAGSLRSGRGLLVWHVPAPWKVPLAAWALLLAVSWPLVVLRELDFSPALLNDFHLANTGVGIAPAEAASGILDLALVQIVGLLWFDWLCGSYEAADRRRFERQIVLPMAAMALVACLVAVYQGLVDIDWLGRGRFPVLGRAGGTMVDANAFGTMAAMWGPVLLAFGFSAGAGRHRRVAMGLGGVALLVAAAGVWMSASRTALLVLGIGSAGAVAVAARAGGGFIGARRRRILTLGAVPAVLLAAVIALVATSSASRGPAARIREMVPSLSDGHVSTLVDRLWNRGWYGPAAHLMIREHPFVGVGVGAFYTLVEQYSRRVGRVVTVDNAQNWYRHQLAELGIVGSLPWIVWFVLFARFLFGTHGEGGERVPAGVVKAALVGLGVTSLFGMPTQNAGVAFTFWTFVFWYVRLVDRPGAPATAGLRARPVAADLDAGSAHAGRLRAPFGRRGTWTLVVLLVTAYAAGTLYAARGGLRVPYRAARGAANVDGAWSYQYGLYSVERSPARGEFRWTKRKAVAVVPAPARRRPWMRLTVWASHPDARQHPLSARVWGYGRDVVIDVDDWDGSPITRYLPVEYGHTFVETWISRTWKPSEHGSHDTRDLGMALAWDFLTRAEYDDELAGRTAGEP